MAAKLPKRPRGRPPIGRSTVVSFRLRPEEIRRLIEIGDEIGIGRPAELARMIVTDFLRGDLVRATPETTAPPAQNTDLDRTVKLAREMFGIRGALADEKR